MTKRISSCLWTVAALLLPVYGFSDDDYSSAPEMFEYPPIVIPNFNNDATNNQLASELGQIQGYSNANQERASSSKSPLFASLMDDDQNSGASCRMGGDDEDKGDLDRDVTFGVRGGGGASGTAR